MSIKDVLGSLSKKYAGVIADILIANDIADKSDISSMCRGLLKIGVDSILYIKDGKVIFSTYDSFIGKEMKIGDFYGLKDIDKYRIAKKVFKDPDMRRFETFRLSDNDGFVVIFKENALEHQIALVDLLMKVKIWQMKTLSNEFLRLKTAVEFVYKIDRETYMHSYRTKEYSKYMARMLGLSNIREIKIGATLHDIGKLLVPSEILKKDSKLNEDEFEVIKSHSFKSYQILKSLGFDGCVLDIALMHHERIDGSGYPLGEKNIPLCVQVVAISDIIDAVQSSRSYKEKQGVSTIIKELKRLDGAFSSDIIKTAVKFVKSDAFFILKKRFDIMSRRVFSGYNVRNFNVLLEKINILKAKNASFEKEISVYKKIVNEVQSKYEEVISNLNNNIANKKHVNKRLDLSIDTAFDLLSRVGDLKSVLLLSENKIAFVKGEAVSVEIVNNCSVLPFVSEINLKNKRKMCAIFKDPVTIPPSLLFAIEGLF